MEHEFLGLKVRFEGESVLVRSFGGSPAVVPLEEYLEKVLLEASLAARALRESRLKGPSEESPSFEEVLKTPLRELTLESFLPKKSSHGLPSKAGFGRRPSRAR